MKERENAGKKRETGCQQEGDAVREMMKLAPGSKGREGE